jgi:hypothetical protein
MLPPAAPLELWSAGAELESKREQLYRDVWHTTSGRVYVPYRRYFTNYDEWLRLNPLWRRMTDDLLLRSDSRVTEYVSRSRVTQLVEEHRSAARTHYARILQLMTLELFLREFFA